MALGVRTTSKVAAYAAAATSFFWLATGAITGASQGSPQELWLALGLLFSVGFVASLASLATSVGATLAQQEREMPGYVWGLGSRTALIAVNCRVAFLWLAGAALLYPMFSPTGGVDRLRLAVGAVLGLIGLVIRSAAILYRSNHEGLLTEGPYGIVRHPRYLGTLLGFGGLGLAVSPISFALAGWVFLLIFHIAAAIHEESELTFRFSGQYAVYRRTVPGWLPRQWRPLDVHFTIRGALHDRGLLRRLAMTWVPGVAFFAILLIKAYW